MTYLKSYKNEKGIILSDIIVAFGLCTIMVAALSENLFVSRRLFSLAKEKENALNYYTGESTSTDYVLQSSTKPFGNEFVELSEVVSPKLTYSSSTNASSQKDQSITFTKIMPGPVATSSQPLCTVNFVQNQTVGGYKFIHPNAPHITAPSSKVILLPINPALPLTHLEVKNNIAFISANSNVSADPDLLIFDINDTNNPLLLSQINTGPGIESFAIYENNIYAAAASTAAQLHIISFDSTYSLSLRKKFTLPLAFATATPAFASAITYRNGLAFLGTEKSDATELSIIDVRNITSPQKVGGFETDSKINDLQLRGNFLYIADSDQHQFRVLDISDMSHLSLLATFSPSGWQRQEGKSITIFENDLVFGRTSGGFDVVADPEIFLFSASSSANLSTSSSLNIPGGNYGVILDRNFAFAADREANKEFRVISKSAATSSGAYSLTISPQSITCDDNRVYILAHNAPAIYEIAF